MSPDPLQPLNCQLPDTATAFCCPLDAGLPLWNVTTHVRLTGPAAVPFDAHKREVLLAWVGQKVPFNPIVSILWTQVRGQEGRAVAAAWAGWCARSAEQLGARMQAAADGHEAPQAAEPLLASPPPLAPACSAGRRRPT